MKPTAVLELVQLRSPVCPRRCRGWWGRIGSGRCCRPVCDQWGRCRCWPCPGRRCWSPLNCGCRAGGRRGCCWGLCRFHSSCRCFDGAGAVLLDDLSKILQGPVSPVQRACGCCLPSIRVFAVVLAPARCVRCYVDFPYAHGGRCRQRWFGCGWACGDRPGRICGGRC